MNIPTEADWRSEDWEGDLDTEWAYREFHGKTMEEAVRLFEDNALRCSENLIYMPNRVFGFYLKAYITYLMSDAAVGDSNGASCFIGLIRLRAESKRDDIIPLWPEIEPMLKYLAEHQERFEAEWIIYGCFRSQIHEIVQLGFATSFETEVSELVPSSVTLTEMGLFGHRPLTLPVAVQILRNSDIDQIDAASSKPDILRVFGTPDAVGGGEHPKYGYIPDWIIYRWPECLIRFEFEGNTISNVTFMHRSDWKTIQSVAEGKANVEKYAARQAEARAAWEALWKPQQDESSKWTGEN